MARGIWSACSRLPLASVASSVADLEFLTWDNGGRCFRELMA